MNQPTSLGKHVNGTTGSDPTVQIRKATPGESVRDGFERRIIHTDHLMAVVIDIENGPWKQADPPHTHPHEQITYVVSGDILFLCERLSPVRLTAGDLYAIPPNLPHSIQLFSKTARLVDCFTPLRVDFLDKQ